MLTRLRCAVGLVVLVPAVDGQVFLFNWERRIIIDDVKLCPENHPARRTLRKDKQALLCSGQRKMFKFRLEQHS